MSDLLSIGASGVSAYQTALTTISDNIANTGTAGYSRRTVALSEISAVGGGLTARSVASGNGVLVGGIVRSGDTYKSAAVRTASTDLAKTETGATWLDRIQTALTGNQLGDRLTSFFDAATTLSADPTSSASRASMLETANSAAASFSATGTALAQVATDLDSTALQATQSLTSLGQVLAKINDGLGRTAPGTTAAAQLADQRDSTLEQMSAIADIAVTTDDAGRATVKLGGAQGATFVGGTESGRVAYLRGENGAVGFAVQRAGTTTTFAPTGGALAGVADSVGRVADAQAALNGVASDFTTKVNAVQTQGTDLNGKTGTALFATGTTPTDITVALDDPSGIAAASAGGGTRDASNLVALQSVRTAAGFETRTTTLVSDNAAALEQRKSIADAQSAIRDGAVSARDAVSSVDLDTEAVDLLRFQQAYSASSRVIQVARETLQSILDIR